MRSISNLDGQRALANGVTLCALLLLLAAPAAAQRGGGGGGGGGGRGGGRGNGFIGGTGVVTELPGATPLGLSTSARIPADNPLTPEKISLGRKLFNDPVLSRDRTVACVSCHQTGVAFADSLVVSGGILGRMGGRNSPTLFNRVYGRSFFWDGRAATLEQAVLMPIQDTLEMSMTMPESIRRVAGDAAYRRLFQAAFPGTQISDVTIAQALASYVRTLRSGNSAFDRYRAGDLAALSPRAIRGMDLFNGRADCDDCHRGANFSDENFEALGIPSADVGRLAATGNERDRGRFKVPTLRDVALTAPYMHDGSLPTLEAVVDFYDRGGGVAGAAGGRGRRDIRPIGLSAAEKTDLVIFLRALTSDTRTQ